MTKWVILGTRRRRGRGGWVRELAVRTCASLSNARFVGIEI
jgi:hypothetical protein